MEEEIKEKVIEAAKAVLGDDYNSDKFSEGLLLMFHNFYINWDENKKKQEGGFDLRAEHSNLENATNKYISLLDKAHPIFNLCEAKARISDDLKVFRTFLEKIRLAPKKMEEDTESIYVEMGLKHPNTVKKGRPPDYRLYDYIGGMALWFDYYIGKEPGWGTGSIFPNLIANCLKVIDPSTKYREPPFKAIRTVLTWHRKELSEEVP